LFFQVADAAKLEETLGKHLAFSQGLRESLSSTWLSQTALCSVGSCRFTEAVAYV